MLSKEVANQYHRSLVDYMEQNGEDPHDNGKTFYEVYWSKAQVFTKILIRIKIIKLIYKKFIMYNSYNFFSIRLMLVNIQIS